MFKGLFSKEDILFLCYTAQDTTHLAQVNFIVSIFCNHIGNIFSTLKPVFGKASFKILKNFSNLDLRARQMSFHVASLC